MKSGGYIISSDPGNPGLNTVPESTILSYTNPPGSQPTEGRRPVMHTGFKTVCHLLFQEGSLWEAKPARPRLGEPLLILEQAKLRLLQRYRVAEVEVLLPPPELELVLLHLPRLPPRLFILPLQLSLKPAGGLLMCAGLVLLLDRFRLHLSDLLHLPLHEFTLSMHLRLALARIFRAPVRFLDLVTRAFLSRLELNFLLSRLLLARRQILHHHGGGDSKGARREWLRFGRRRAWEPDLGLCAPIRLLVRREILERPLRLTMQVHRRLTPIGADTQTLERADVGGGRLERGQARLTRRIYAFDDDEDSLMLVRPRRALLAGDIRASGPKPVLAFVLERNVEMGILEAFYVRHRGVELRTALGVGCLDHGQQIALDLGAEAGLPALVWLERNRGTVTGRFSRKVWV
jgi:hypothetical protein